MSEPDTQPSFVFGGFDSPNTTQVPDAFFDVVAPQLTEAELRVALYIIRRTFGFKKDSDNISLRQMVDGITTKDGRVLDRGTGLRKSAVANALNGLEHKGVILKQRNQSRERGHEPTTYALNIKNHPLSVPVDKGLSAYMDKGLSVPVDTQYTERQQTVLQQTENSNSFESQTQVFNDFTNSKFSKQSDVKIQSSADQQNSEPAQSRRGKSNFQPVGQVLAGRGVASSSQTGSVTAKNGSPAAPDLPPGTRSHPEEEAPQKRPRGRPRSYPLPPDLELFTRDITHEFHDASKEKPNLSFIGRVLHETGLPSSVLYQLMQEARQITKGVGNIEKPSDDDPGFRNRWPYFRSTLLDLVEKVGRGVSARRRPHAGSP